MYSDSVLRLICLFSVGLSLLLAGLANALFRSTHPITRIAINLVPSIAVLLGSWLLTNNFTLLLQTAALLVLVLVPSLLLDSDRVASIGAKLLGYCRRPLVRWGLVSAGGMLIVVGSLVAYEREDEQSLNESMRDLHEMATCPPLKVNNRVQAKTDRGNKVVLQEPLDPKSESELNDLEKRLLKSTSTQNQFIRHQSPTDNTNCHGWVFTGGRFWVSGVEVDAILSENAYKPVEQPQPGDLVIYRDTAGSVSHSGVVRYVTPGFPVMVEGKWGTTGVYLHAVDQSVYGKSYNYYRSPRSGHLLTGLDDSLRSDPKPLAASE